MFNVIRSIVFLTVWVLSSIWFIVASSPTHIIEPVIKDARKLCPVKWAATNHIRDALPLYGTTQVVDRNGNNMLDDEDIQQAIDIAARRYRVSGEMQRVWIQEQDDLIFMKETLILASWVVLDWSWNDIYMHPDAKVDSAIIIPKWSKYVWIHDLHIRFNGVFTRDNLPWLWIIYIDEGASYVYIYDNLFVNDKMEVRESIWNTDSNVGITVAWASRVFIDNNRFSHVPLWVKILWDNARHIKVTNNLFHKWRIRAIYVTWAEQAIHHIQLAHNVIQPPLTWTVRQPIAFHANNWAQTYNVQIHDNYIEWHDTYHYARWVNNPDGTRTRITTDTNWTADMMGFHNMNNFVVSRNCIINGGELGIQISSGSQNGKIINNYIYRTDVWWIALWAKDGAPVKNIIIRSNQIIDSARNRQKKVVDWARAGIVLLINAEDITIGNNLIQETERNYLDTWESYTMAYGISLFRVPDEEVTMVAPNVYDLSDDVEEYGVSW